VGPALTSVGVKTPLHFSAITFFCQICAGKRTGRKMNGQKKHGQTEQLDSEWIRNSKSKTSKTSVDVKNTLGIFLPLHFSARFARGRELAEK
jgi:hypothetical protein